MSEAFKINATQERGLLSPEFIRERLITLRNEKNITDNLPANLAEAYKQKYSDTPYDNGAPFNELIEHIRLLDDDETFLSKAVVYVQRFLRENFTEEFLINLYNNSRNSERTDPDYVLSDLMHVIPKGDALQLHILASNTDNAGKLMSVLNSFEVLAKRWKSEEKFKDYATLVASSQIVANHQSVLKYFGFTIVEGKPYQASISKEDFLNRYLK